MPIKDISKALEQLGAPSLTVTYSTYLWGHMPVDDLERAVGGQEEVSSGGGGDYEEPSPTSLAAKERREATTVHVQHLFDGICASRMLDYLTAHHADLLDAFREEAHMQGQLDGSECFLASEHAADMATKVVASAVVRQCKAQATNKPGGDGFVPTTAEVSEAINALIQTWFDVIEGQDGRPPRQLGAAEPQPVVYESMVVRELDTHLRFLKMVRSFDATSLPTPEDGGSLYLLSMVGSGL